MCECVDMEMNVWMCVCKCMDVSMYECIYEYMDEWMYFYLCMYVWRYVWCMYVCVCMCVCIYMYVCMYANICMMYVYVYVCVYVCICMYVSICMYVCMDMRMCVCQCNYVSIDIWICIWMCECVYVFLSSPSHMDMASRMWASGFGEEVDDLRSDCDKLDTEEPGFDNEKVLTEDSLRAGTFFDVRAVRVSVRFFPKNFFVSLNFRFSDSNRFWILPESNTCNSQYITPPPQQCNISS